MAQTMDFGELKATVQEDGRVSIAFAQGIPIAAGPVVQVKQETVLLLAAWVQSTITGAKFEAVGAKAVPGKREKDFEEIKKFIDDLQKKIPGIIGSLRGIYPHPFTKAMETALAGTMRAVIEEIISEEPTLREKFKELIKNMIEDAISKDENWEEGQEPA